MDEVKANSLGWKTKSFEDLHLIHQRPTGQADGRWAALVKYGRANYICGYHPLFIFAKMIRRITVRPRILGAIGLMYGYVTGYLMRIPQIPDPSAIAYLRSQQISRLLGKESIWE
jgi:hypothetical protein